MTLERAGVVQGMGPEITLESQRNGHEVHERVMHHGLSVVVFDFDGVLTREEGIIALARRRGPEVEAHVAVMTEEAMSGKSTDVEGLFIRRLEAIGATPEDLDAVGQECLDGVLGDAHAVVTALHYLGVQTHIISGGYEETVHPLGAHLGIPTERIHTNRVVYTPDGARLDQEGPPLWRADGKATVIGELQDTGRFGDGFSALVGDGGTDVAGANKVKTFIGFGGVSRRPAVEEASPFYVIPPHLSPVLALAVGVNRWEELAQSPHGRPLVDGIRRIAKEDEVVLKWPYGALREYAQGFLRGKL